MQNQILEDVRKILLSLLVSRKGNSMPITVLEKEYYDMEGRCIPYRQFGYSDLVLFLQNMPDYFNVVQTNGNYYVYGIASEKSKHVSSMVARQKSDLKKYNITHSRSFNRRYYGGKHQPVRITPDKLYQLMQYIKGIPAGVSLDNARGFVQNLVPYVEVNKEDLRQQLRELSHQLCLDGNMIYPICNDSPDMNQAQPLMKKDWLSLPPHDSQKRNPSKSPSDSASPLNENICAAGQEDSECMYFSDENYFVPAGCRVHNQKRATTCEQLATNIAQYAKNEETDVSYNQVQNEIEIDEEFLMMDSKSKTEIKTQEISDIVSDKIKSRLEELLRKYPEGIWCAQLPDLYLEEYKVRLNYTKLGFTSVREFTSYLPKIFYMTQINKTDDFLLFHAEKRPVVPKTEPIDIVQSSHKQHDEHDTVQAEYNNNDDDAPIPSEISPTITKRFAPDDVMNYDDNVGKISVTELQLTRKFLEIYIIEVFHPSFFWIQLRENVKRFNAMMEELSEFYELNKDTYAIPRVALKKDMHCACVYMNRWHRGLIKRVKPDYRVTVFFYDYGTLKTYPSDEIYYLHKKFSALPAQAIPCGLYNVIPTTGERWKKSVNDQFIDKIADTLLAATIMSVNATDNSMLVVLVDVSEEEDVKINDWLVNERLALIGKTVRIKDVNKYLIYDFEFSTSTRTCDTFKTERAIDVDQSRYRRNQSISRDEKTLELSDVESKNNEKKTVEPLHNFSTIRFYMQNLKDKINAKSLSVKSPLAESIDVKSPDTRSLDVKSSSSTSANPLDTRLLNAKSPDIRSRNHPQNEWTRKKPFSLLLLEFKTSKFNQKSNSNSNTSISETNTENEDSTRQTDLNTKVNSQYSRDYNCYGYTNFGTRDSDKENCDDFGTLRSLYGGHGSMEPFDWSLIREKNNTKTNATLLNKESTKDCKNDANDKLKLYDWRNELANSIAAKQFFLNMTRMEEENFLPENNIDYSDAEKSDFIKTLENKVVHNNIVTVMFTPNDKLKTLLNNIQSENVSNLNIKHNDVISLSETDQEIDRNDKVCKISTDEEINNKNSNTDLESIISNISNKDDINSEMSKSSTNNSLEFNTSNKTCKSRSRWKVPEIIKHKRTNLTNCGIINTNESSSSDQIQSSSSSTNTSSNTIISSNDDQSEAFNQMNANTHVETNNLDKVTTSTPEDLPKNPTLNELYDSDGLKDLSALETGSIASSNVDGTNQRHQLNQSFDSVASSCNVDYLKCQLTAENQTSKLMRMLKIMQNIDNNTELDSDDLTSSRESIEDDKSDESKGNVKLFKSDSTFNLMNDDANVAENAYVPPIYNDCDVQSDERDWDYAGSFFTEEFTPFYIAQSENSEIRD